MSLINQVLQDLDQRRATPATMPAAARGVQARSAWRRSQRWAGTTGAALAGAAFACAGALAWNHAQSTAGEAYVPSSVRPAPAPAVAPALVAAPVLAAPPVLAAAPAAPATAMPTLLAATPTPGGAAPAVVAAAPVVGTATVAAIPPPLAAGPAATRDLPPSLAALAAPIAAPIPMAAEPAVHGSALPTTPARMPAPAEVRVAMAAVGAAPATRTPAPAAGADAIGPLPALLPPVTATSPAEARVEKRLAPTTPRERAEAAYQRGLGLHAQGRTEDAEAAFMNALQEDRAHAPARLALAVSLAGHGAAEEARNLLADGLELQPRQLALAATLARLKSQNHDLPGAIATLKSAIAAGAPSAPAAEQAQAFALLATLQQSALQHAPAIENYAAALRLAPNNGAWWIGMGLSLAADGRPESAREAYARARSTDSLSAELQQFVDQRLR